MKLKIFKTIPILLLMISINALAVSYEVTTAETSPYILNDGDSISISNLGSITLSGNNNTALGDYFLNFNPTNIGAILNNGTLDISGGSNLYGVRLENLFNNTAVVSFTNSGLLSINSEANGYGVSIENGNSIGPIINTGTISVVGSALTWPYGSNMYGIDTSDGIVASINNSGSINIQSTGDNSYGVSVASTDFVINSGTITVSNAGNNSYGISGGFGFSNTINNLTNSGSISAHSDSDNAYGIDLHYTTINSNLINSGTITVSSSGNNAEGIYVGDVNTIRNSNNITVSSDGSNVAGIHIDLSSTVQLIDNSGSINSTSGASGYNAYGLKVDVFTTIVDFQNSGTITSSGQNSCALCITVASVNNINNSGTLNAYGTNAFGVDNTIGTIGSITNTGVIYGDDSGISNSAGTIAILNNLQGGDGLTASKTALTYRGTLPTNYNIIIYSTSHYGQLNVDSNNYSGQLTFGISNLSSTNIGVSGTRYQNVITGVASGDILNFGSAGTYSNGNLSATYELVADDNSAADTWDLLILSMINGPSAYDTQASLHSLAPKLRGAFSSQTVATNFANMNTYDCNLFDAKGLCVSVGGQQTYVDSPSSNMTSAVVVAGYKVSPTLRIGGFLNQNLNNNTGSNVAISNNSPLMGLFSVWNQNENHLGYQVKIANAYQDMDVTTTRDVIGTSEAGRGKTDLNTQSYVGELSYAVLANDDKTLVRPYAAVRYTRIKQDAYTEQTTSTVTAPLTYASLEDRSTAALVGVKLDHKLADNFHLKGSVGIEQDLYHQVDNLTATGVSGLTSENFNDNIKRTRPVASIGAYFIPAKNQRITADLYYQQLPFQSTGSTTAYVNYTIGF